MLIFLNLKYLHFTYSQCEKDIAVIVFLVVKKCEKKIVWEPIKIFHEIKTNSRRCAIQKGNILVNISLIRDIVRRS